MTTIGEKVAYVKAESQRGAGNHHHCHWPGCDKAVPPAMWGCTRHWYMLPADLRRAIWRTFRPGQEVSKTPSAEYIATARRVREWINTHTAAQIDAGELPARGQSD